jgi:hypothetical protein
MAPAAHNNRQDVHCRSFLWRLAPAPLVWSDSARKQCPLLVWCPFLIEKSANPSKNSSIQRRADATGIGLSMGAPTLPALRVPELRLYATCGHASHDITALRRPFLPNDGNIAIVFKVADRCMGTIHCFGDVTENLLAIVPDLFPHAPHSCG